MCSKNSARRRVIRFVTQARSEAMPNGCSKKCNVAASKGLSANSATPFTNPAAEAAHGSNSNVLTSRNSSLADTRRRRVRANTSARSSLGTTRITIWCLPAKSVPASLSNRYPCCTRNSKKKRATIVHLSICHQDKTGNGSWGSRLP